MQHRLVIEVMRSDGNVIGHISPDPDWDPAIEWTRLAGLRLLGTWAPEPQAEHAITPVWHSDLGEPFMRGFRVSLADATGNTWHEEFSIRYFAHLAQAAAADLRKQGTLAESESYLYRALAYHPVAADEDAGDVAHFTAHERTMPLVLHDLSPEWRARASSRRDDAGEHDFEVYLPAEVLEEANALTAGAGEVETGGILIGHLVREPLAPGRDSRPSNIASGDIGVAITALIPARHTLGSSAKLTFTSDTWTDVRRTIELRRRDEMALGWFHSHPHFVWCRERGCSLEEQRRCASARGFFSADDGALHRTMFPRAFTVALVMTQSVQGILPRLFGWRGGLLEPRGYRVIDHPNPAREISHATHISA